MSANITVDSPAVQYTDDAITSTVNYDTTDVTVEGGKYSVKPRTQKFTFKTERKVPKIGMMLVGWGGNNGSTVTGAMIANKKKIEWDTKNKHHKSNFFGSLLLASTTKLGRDAEGKDIYVPFSDMMPLVQPDDIVIDGWDINDANIGDAMRRAQVFEFDLQRQLYDELKDFKPRPSIYVPDFIAANQETRANNCLTGTKFEMMQRVRSDIRDFKATHSLDKVIVLWTANTERFSDVRDGLNMTADELLTSIKDDAEEISASTLFACASILENSSYINGSPQNTFVPGVIDLACQRKVYIGGDDFKSGQTKMKSVLVDFLVGAGLKPTSIVSYNHLGNNDGKNLSAPKQFRSKEISKSNVVDDMVESNRILYDEGEHPDHVVVIKYVPAVQDSKRAMDEYTSEIFMGGLNTIVMHNTCEDSLLASPLIIDLVLLTEICERITFKEDDGEWERFHSVLSMLSFLLKAPLVPSGTPIVNALFKQRACIENIFRACLGLSPENNMLLEHKRGGVLPTTEVVENVAALPVTKPVSPTTAAKGGAVSA